MSESFNMYWTNLPKYGDPNGKLDPKAIFWPRFNASMDLNLYLDVPPRVGVHLADDTCA